MGSSCSSEKPWPAKDFIACRARIPRVSYPARARVGSFYVHLPPLDGCDPLVAEALFVSRHHLEDRRARMHKRVLCAGGCGTRFGKRRRDHDFLGGEGIHGGWLCPTTPCKGQSTGDHHCGMCLEELQQASGARRVPDVKMVLIDLDAHAENPDLQDY